MDSIDGNLQANLQSVRARIARAAAACGRAADTITLIAVSKTFGADVIAAACAAGQRAFGENYLQEALSKIETLISLPLEWHFIGPIQSNKTHAVARHFTWVHGIDHVKTAQRLSQARPAALPPLNVLIQVNIDDEASKRGVAPAGAAALARTVSTLPGLRLRGLMTIPRPMDEASTQRRAYAALRTLRDDIAAGGLELDALSMGMSSDLEAAIAEGATLVRVGTAIFGQRAIRDAHSG